jgi:hypothetical protein
LAVAITACVDATRSTATEPALYEGAPVSLAGSIQVSANIDGKLVSSAVHQWAIDGVVRSGVAEAEKAPGTRADNMVMPALAVSDNHPLARGRPNERFATTAKDKSGNAHEFVFRAGETGGPSATIAHLENGKIAEVFSYDWQKVRGGWVAKGFAVTVFRDGKPILTVRSGSKLTPGAISMMHVADDPCMFDAQYSALSGNCSSAPVFQGGGAGALGSTPNDYIDGSAPCTCASELYEYLNAAWAAGMGTQLAIETAQIANPIALAGLGGLWVYAAYRLALYNSCVRACRASASAGSISNPAATDRFTPFDIERGFA